jgi:hypothetical protein
MSSNSFGQDRLNNKRHFPGIQHIKQTLQGVAVSTLSLAREPAFRNKNFTTQGARVKPGGYAESKTT